MAVSAKFASGKYAWGVCDRCGAQARLLSLRTESVMGREIHLRTCESCWDSDHPQNHLPKFVQNDAQALRDPRPDTGAMQSRILNPPGNWVNGRRPTPEQLKERWLQMEAEREQQRALWRQQAEADRLRPRRFL